MLLNFIFYIYSNGKGMAIKIFIFFNTYIVILFLSVDPNVIVLAYIFLKKKSHSACEAKIVLNTTNT